MGINFGNVLLANKDANGQPNGIAVDLANELSRRADVPLQIIAYGSGGALAAGAKSGDWDVAFLAIDPGRAVEIVFTSPYVEVDSTYLVRRDSPIHQVEDVDRPGVRIAVSGNSAYDLFLARNIKHATLVRAAGPAASARQFFEEELEVLAGLRPVLIEIGRDHFGTRVLEGRFTAVQQAAGVPRDRSAAAAYVGEFVNDCKASGFVAEAVRNSGISGLSLLA